MNIPMSMLVGSLSTFRGRRISPKSGFFIGCQVFKKWYSRQVFNCKGIKNPVTKQSLVARIAHYCEIITFFIKLIDNNLAISGISANFATIFGNDINIILMQPKSLNISLRNLLQDTMCFGRSIRPMRFAGLGAHDMATTRMILRRAV